MLTARARGLAGVKRLPFRDGLRAHPQPREHISRAFGFPRPFTEVDRQMDRSIDHANEQSVDGTSLKAYRNTERLTLAPSKGMGNLPATIRPHFNEVRGA